MPGMLDAGMRDGAEGHPHPRRRRVHAGRTPSARCIGIGKELNLQFVLGYEPARVRRRARWRIAEGKVDARADDHRDRSRIDGVPQAFADLGNPDAHAKILVQP